MSFALSYKGNSSSPTLFSQTTTMAYARSYGKLEPPRKPIARAESSQRPRSDRTKSHKELNKSHSSKSHSSKSSTKSHSSSHSTSSTRSKMEAANKEPKKESRKDAGKQHKTHESRRSSKHPRRSRAPSSRSTRSMASRRSGVSVFDAISLIDTYMCDASVIDFPMEDESAVNPFVPLPDINLEKYQNAIDPQNIESSENLSNIVNSVEQNMEEDPTEAQLRKDLISQVFSEEELVRLSHIMNDLIDGEETMNEGNDSMEDLEELEEDEEEEDDDDEEEDDDDEAADTTAETTVDEESPEIDTNELQGKSLLQIFGDSCSISESVWDDSCPTKVSGTPLMDTDKRPASVLQSSEKTPVNSDDEYEFQLPIGVDSSPVLPQKIFRNSSIVRRKSISSSKAVIHNDNEEEKHMSDMTLNIDTKPREVISDSTVLRRIRKIRNKLEFTDEEFETIKVTWQLIFEINQPNDVINNGSQEHSTHRRSDNLCAYSFTKQFYNNLLKHVEVSNELFPLSTKKQIVYFGNILNETTKHLDNLEMVKSYLHKNRYSNQDHTSGCCSKTIFSHKSIDIEKHGHYFGQFGKVFLKTLNENYPEQFTMKMEIVWVKYYQFLFSCIVGGFKSSEREMFSNSQTKTRSRVNSAMTVNIDDVRRESKMTVLKEEVEDAYSEHTDSETVGDRTIPTVIEVPFSVAAFRTSPTTDLIPQYPSIEQSLPRKKKLFETTPHIFQRIMKSGPQDNCTYVTNGKKIDKNAKQEAAGQQRGFTKDELKLINKLRMLKSTFKLFQRKQVEKDGSHAKDALPIHAPSPYLGQSPVIRGSAGKSSRNPPLRFPQVRSPQRMGSPNRLGSPKRMASPKKPVDSSFEDLTTITTAGSIHTVEDRPIPLPKDSPKLDLQGVNLFNYPRSVSPVSMQSKAVGNLTSEDAKIYTHGNGPISVSRLPHHHQLRSTFVNAN